MAKNSTTKNLKYSEAIEQLEQIQSALENDEISVDELSEKVKYASELLAFCKEKLHKTEKEVSQILDDLKES